MSISGETEYCEEQIEKLREDLDELYLLKMHKLATLLSIKKRLAKLKGLHE